MLYKKINPSIDRVVEKKAIPSLLLKIEQAQKFTFSTETTALVREIVDAADRDPRVVARLAREPLPFPATYLEFDLSDDGPPPFQYRIGFAFIDNNIYHFAGNLNDDGSEAALLPYAMHRPPNPQPIPNFPENPKQFKIPENAKGFQNLQSLQHLMDARILFGDSGIRLLEDQRNFNALAPYIRLVEGVKYRKDQDKDTKAFLEKWISGLSGSAALPLAALAVINQRQAVTVIEIKPSARLIKGKRIATPRHFYVDVKIENQPHIYRALGPLGFMRKSPEGHSVRASWVHYHIDPACDHDWPTEPNFVGRHYCPRCGGFRVRRKSHDRGGTPTDNKPYVIRA